MMRIDGKFGNHAISNRRSMHIGHICLLALIIRLVVIVLIYFFEQQLGTSFMVPDIVHDDVMYITGAMRYKASAARFFDKNAFYTSMTSVGHLAMYSKENFFFWFVSLAFYILGHELWIRIINVGFAVLTIRIVYAFAMLISDEKSALMSAKLLAFLPYPVIFSCFIFKDQLMMLCTMFLLLQIGKFSKGIQIRTPEYVAVVVSVVTLANTRNGFAGIMLFLFIGVMLANIVRRKGRPKISTIIIIVFVTVGGIVSLGLILQPALRKMNAYLMQRQAYTQGLISFISINKPLDIYKFPIAFPFSIMQPLPVRHSVLSWMDITGYLSFTMIPIAVGNFLYLFKRDKADKVLYWANVCLICGVLVMSLGIFRHYYSLLPLPLVYYSVYTAGRKSNLPLLVGSFVLFLFWLLYYYFL